MTGTVGLALVAWHQWVYHEHTKPQPDNIMRLRRAPDEFDTQMRFFDGFAVVSYLAVVIAGAIEVRWLLGIALLWLVFSGSWVALTFMRHGTPST